MILLLARAEDDHAPAVMERLRAAGAEHHWFDPARFPTRAELLLGVAPRTIQLVDGGRTVDLTTVRAALLRPFLKVAPAARASTQNARVTVEESESALAAAWDAVGGTWLPATPITEALACNKPRQLALAQQSGFVVPRTLVTNDPDAAVDFIAASDGRVVSKALVVRKVDHHGALYFAYTHVVDPRDGVFLATLRNGPVIFQEYVAKAVEIRVTVVGDEAFTAEIHSQDQHATRDDWRRPAAAGANVLPHRLPPPVEAQCHRLLSLLGLSAGALDLILTPRGEYVFLEVNSLGDWLWVEQRTGLPITDATVRFLLAAEQSRD